MTDTVLLVDDDEDIRETLRDFLEDQGYRVAVAANGQEALDRLHELGQPPCFVLLDLMMPIMDGWRFLDAISGDEHLAQMPVVVSTSAPERAPVDRRVIPKPVDLVEILDAVRTHCSCEDAAAPA